MRSRADIKEIARGQFRQRYGMCVGATLLAMLLGGMSSDGSLSIDYNLNDGFQTETMNVSWLLPAIIGIGVFVLLVSIFVSGPVTVGYAGFTSRIFVGVETGVADMFRTGFRDYWRSVGGMLWMNLFIWLWSLLFIIPGIVKSYAYFATPYILAEFPGVDPTEALKISMRMTHGYKGDVFVMGLSFIGWQLLNGLTFGILGLLYVNPYFYTSMAGLYQELKMNALTRGTVRYEELTGQPAPQYGAQG
jgi:uncharacterized membrane protein